jgi:hypothetical protein
VKATYGFRATLLADEPRFQDEAPVGGKFRD